MSDMSDLTRHLKDPQARRIAVNMWNNLWRHTDEKRPYELVEAPTLECPPDTGGAHIWYPPAPEAPADPGSAAGGGGAGGGKPPRHSWWWGWWLGHRMG